MCHFYARPTQIALTTSTSLRNWHPGPLAFEFLSDTFAYVYSKAMLMALDLIESDMKAGKDPRDTWSSTKRKILMKKSLPEPKFCDPNYCGALCYC